MSVAKVIIDLSLDKAFDYNIPRHLEQEIHVGVQVEVPFGRSKRRGYVLHIVEKSDFKDPLKDIASICERHTRIPKPLIKLGRWMADYYCCSQEQAIRTLLPRAVRSGKIKHKTLSLFSIANTQAAEQFVIEQHSSKRYEAQVRVLKTLLRHQQVAQEQLLKEANVTISPIKSLLKKELITLDKKIVKQDFLTDASIISDQVQKPTTEQQTALDKILSMLDEPTDKHTLLLYGITGSGKTEVYLQAIARALELGKESIVLVPEIALTPQTVRRFRARFGDMVSVLHSRLTERERFDQWSKINDGEVKIVVGARSALFAPFRNLGLIIVDEEHESSYKQAESPRYHARDVAVLRGKLEKAVVVLGSATPSFESYQNARLGKYEFAELANRVDNCFLPKVRVVDSRLGSMDGNKQPFWEDNNTALGRLISNDDITKDIAQDMLKNKNVSNISPTVMANLVCSSRDLRTAYIVAKNVELGLKNNQAQDDYFFWDSVHPSRVVHRILGEIAIEYIQKNFFDK